MLPEWRFLVPTNFIAGKRREVLEWLSEVKCEDHHAEVVRTRLEGTGAWLLQRKEIREWLESEGSSTLWLHGKGSRHSASVC